MRVILDINSVKCVFSKGKCDLCRKYVRYLLQSTTAVFTILSAIKRAILQLFSAIIDTVSLFDYGIYSSGNAHSNSVCLLKNK